MPDFPSGTVTFLFTDIEGSTRLWEEKPDAMRLALARHDQLIRKAIESQGGYVFKTVGDAFCAAFATASQAVSASLDAQRALAEEAWGETGTLRVRMALHTGAAEIRDGDYFGQPLNRAARLLACGSGEQILLSLATAELVRDLLPEGVALRDLGEHRLRDLVRPEHIFQLLGPGLPADFPPLRTLGSHPNNLPLLLTSLVGREHELSELQDWISAHRLVTLTGSGGVGKTRLALQLAAEKLEAFSDGVWLVELAPLTDPNLVAQVVASVFGVREIPGQPLVEALIGYLRPRHLLLVLDNCEHLVTACAELAEMLLLHCQNVSVLATSREPLGISGEALWRVPSLSLPGREELSNLSIPEFPALLTQYEAVRLFIERAVAVLPTFRVTNDTAPAVAQICQRLDGIPLAIELAAARVRVLSVQQILDRLDDRFRLLRGGSRTAQPRQQTLRAAIDWSYDLLSADERAVLMRLSAFSGGCTLAAVEAVCNATPVIRADVVDSVGLLVDKSLLREETEGGEEPRFVMLESIREYAAEKLRQSGSEQAVRRAHLRYFRLLAEEAEGHLRGAGQLEWIRRLETEVDNFRSALAWAREQGEAEDALRLATALTGFWWIGHTQEGINVLSDALEAGRDLPTGLRARSLFALGYLTQYCVGQAAGRPLLEAAVALCREGGDETTLALALSSLGIEALTRGDPAADTLLDESLTIGRKAANRWDLAYVLFTRGYAAYVQRDAETARTLFEESIAICRAISYRWLLAAPLGFLGELDYRQGNYTIARSRCAESVDLVRRLGDRVRQGTFLALLGRIALGQNDYNGARAAFAEFLDICFELQNRELLVACLGAFASLAWTEGDLERSARLFAAAEALREALGIEHPDPGYRADYAAELDAVRARMEEKGIASAWAEGQSMSTEQALDYARTGRPPT